MDIGLIWAGFEGYHRSQVPALIGYSITCFLEDGAYRGMNALFRCQRGKPQKVKKCTYCARAFFKVRIFIIQNKASPIYRIKVERN